MEVLNEGVSLCLLVPAATVSCSSSAYRLCNCYYFFLSLTLLFFYSPLCDFSILHAYVNVITPRENTFTSSILHVFTSTFTSTIPPSILHVFVLHVYDHVHAFNSSRLRSRSRLQFFTSSFFTSTITFTPSILIGTL